MNNNLAELRKSKGLSQEELAEKVFVSRQTIISIEKGRYNPSLELAFKLSIYFNTIIENIFTYEEE
ncbi:MULTISPECIES: helix-turn-helix transcriptional regulator [Trichococcus]|uniref:helix-turn-helix transcriptional regulator n=1 Tax=Trichococcus TaxID=82802 RepID=UPI000E5B4A29|nr:helix-turn-helix transcriptional regulator [Trichococcus shcherbakoviae]